MKKVPKSRYEIFNHHQFCLQIPEIFRNFFKKISKKDRNKPIGVTNFSLFSVLVQERFKNIRYIATKNSSGYFFWITKQHAKLIGGVLSRFSAKLNKLTIELTTTEGDEGFGIMQSELIEDSGCQINELIISHKSGDEVTINEVNGLARMVHNVNIETLRIQASEFDDGTIVRFYDTLTKLGNKSLKNVHFYNVSKREVLKYKPLEEFVEENRLRNGRKKVIQVVAEKKIGVSDDNTKVKVETKKKLIKNFILSYSENKNLKIDHVSMFPFFARCNRILYMINLFQDFKRAESLLNDVNISAPESTEFMKGIFFYLKVKVLFLQKKYEEVEKFCEKNKVPMDTSLTTKSWIYSVLSEVYFHRSNVKMVVKSVNECLKTRKEIKRERDILLCYQNAFYFLDEMKQNEICFEFALEMMLFALQNNLDNYLLVALEQIYCSFMKFKVEEVKVKMKEKFSLMYRKKKKKIDNIKYDSKTSYLKVFIDDLIKVNK